jgi:hypothetical protein
MEKIPRKATPVREFVISSSSSRKRTWVVCKVMTRRTIERRNPWPDSCLDFLGSRDCIYRRVLNFTRDPIRASGEQPSRCPLPNSSKSTVRHKTQLSGRLMPPTDRCNFRGTSVGRCETADRHCQLQRYKRRLELNCPAEFTIKTFEALKLVT